MPSGVVTHIESRLLKELVNRAIHPIRCAESCKRKFQKGMYVGVLCAEAGHFWWALRVWRLTARLIEQKDYDDWRYVWFNSDRVRLRDVISEAEYELLTRRESDLWRALGFAEYARWDQRTEHFAASYSGTSYYDLFADKYEGYYDYSPEDFESDMETCRRSQITEQLFREALPDWLPFGSQNFDEYWHEQPSPEDYSWLDWQLKV